MALISKSIQRSQSVLTTNSVLNKKIILNTLGRQEVTALFKKEIQAIVLKEFLPKEVCQLASKRLLSGQIKDYTNAPGIG
jgi:hypothetical protein